MNKEDNLTLIMQRLRDEFGEIEIERDAPKCGYEIRGERFKILVFDTFLRKDSLPVDRIIAVVQTLRNTNAE